MTDGTEVWYEGVNDYYKYTYTPDPEGKMNHFHTEIRDVEIPPPRPFYDALADAISMKKTKTVEVLYSGGLDSEVAVDVCLRNKIPVQAITMKLHVDGIIMNVQDLYYSDKFCRERGVVQKIVDLNIKDFFENGDFLKYLEPYRLIIPHASTHLWLIEQCSGYPVLGGDYNWPWHGTGHIAISPARHAYSCYKRFMDDNNIDGLGSFTNSSLETNLMCMRQHVNMISNDVNQQYGSDHRIIYLKKHLYENLGSHILEPRNKSFGWEAINPKIFDRLYYREYLLKLFGDNRLSISWGQKTADVIGGEPGTWSRLI